MEDERILLVGGGGHCRSVLDCLLRAGSCREIGIIDQESGGELMGVSVIGCDADLPRLFAAGWRAAAVTLGSVGDPARRRMLYQTLREIGFALPVIADPSAVIGLEVELEEGIFIGKGAIVNSGTRVGCCGIINTGAILEHDCTLGDFVHVGPGGVLCGGTRVEENTHIGAGAVVRQQISIGRSVLIGAGSVVIRDIPNGCTVVGNPGRILEK